MEALERPAGLADGDMTLLRQGQPRPFLWTCLHDWGSCAYNVKAAWPGGQQGKQWQYMTVARDVTSFPMHRGRAAQTQFTLYAQEPGQVTLLGRYSSAQARVERTVAL